MNTMNDLKTAILAVLENATDVRSEFHTDDCDDRMAVECKLLFNLQSEFNIYFVEADKPQVSLL